MDIDDLGIFCTDGPTHTRWQWNAFDRFIETRERFFLRLTESNEFIIVPKRAVRDEELAKARELLQKAGQNVTGAFPVLALPPSEGI